MTNKAKTYLKNIQEADTEKKLIGIEIAFNQMDVHIRSIADGREALLQSTAAPPPAGSTGTRG